MYIHINNEKVTVMRMMTQMQPHIQSRCTACPANINIRLIQIVNRLQVHGTFSCWDAAEPADITSTNTGKHDRIYINSATLTKPRKC